jgi:hypothetical protein
MKIFITGYAQHGKDTAAEFIHANYGLTFESSSRFCMRLFVRDQLESRYGLKYETEDECYEDRVNHRATWAVLIAQYNVGDPGKLSRAIFTKYDIYVGIRSKMELDEARHLADLVLWIDRPGWPPEPTSSNTLDKSVADVIVSAKTVPELHAKIKKLFDCMLDSKVYA